MTIDAAVDRPIRIAHYAVRGVIGEGASSVVYLAVHRATGRMVAIKTLRASVAADEQIRARLRLESRVLGRVRGPHLVEALDAGTRDDGAPYLVLERLEGATLSAQIAHGPLPIAATIAVGVAMLDALERLHAAGFVHRDVKPANVMLHHARGVVVPKLIDLGICLDTGADGGPRRTHAGGWIGTPCYMAPEQLASSPVDERTDVYGVGAMLYECLTGLPPHDGRTSVEVATRALHEPVVPVGLRRDDCPRSLERVVMRALEREPSDRYDSAVELRDVLVATREALALPASEEALTELVDPRTAPLPLLRRAHAVATTAGGRRIVSHVRRRTVAGVAAIGLAIAVCAAVPGESPSPAMVRVVVPRPRPSEPRAVATAPHASTSTVVAPAAPAPDASVAPAAAVAVASPPPLRPVPAVRTVRARLPLAAPVPPVAPEVEPFAPVFVLSDYEDAGADAGTDVGTDAAIPLVDFGLDPGSPQSS